MQVRLATPGDAEALLAIYAPFITDTSLTFETEVPDTTVFAERIRSYLENWPWLVCEIDGKIAGYAYASRYRERAGYQWCVECSVYIDASFQRRGIGRRLYKVLFELLARQGYRNVYAVINLPNDPSVKLHEDCGFSWFANYENVGYKLGKWKTVGWWQLIINPYSSEPLPPIAFRDLDHTIVKTCLGI